MPDFLQQYTTHIVMEMLQRRSPFIVLYCLFLLLIMCSAFVAWKGGCLCIHFTDVRLAVPFIKTTMCIGI